MDFSNAENTPITSKEQLKDDVPTIKIIEFPIIGRVEFTYAKDIPELDTIVSKYSGKRRNEGVIGYNNSAMRYIIEYVFKTEEEWNSFCAEASKITKTTTVLNK